VVTGPHIMVLPADPKAVAAVSTDYRTGQPFQMWKGTPYAHIMVPAGASEMQH
jgi:type IV pilus biogenesis protein CpaD/CtpE